MQNQPANASIHLTDEALAHSEAVSHHLRLVIEQAGGWVPFSRWMHEALYAPGLGYYAAGAQKLATRDSLDRVGRATGDFVTAPELSSAFGYTIARQVEQVISLPGLDTILEFGAGSGQLAHDVLSALAARGLHPEYQILEVSADLAQRQQEKLAPFGRQVRWLTELPTSFEGVVLANEVLDAMPAHLVGWDNTSKAIERGVIWDRGQFAWQAREASDDVLAAMTSCVPPLPGYITEINLQAQAWVAAMATWLNRGVAFLIDYGFPQQEYYHPQRHQGTLMCHVQHLSHANPLVLPGLQDITTHVDFSAMAHAAFDAGLTVMGYASQARFLINAGIVELLPSLSDQDRRGLDKLISEAEMGELFKVLAIGRCLDQALVGFARGDRRHQL